MSTDTTTRRGRYVALAGTALLAGLAEAEIRHHVANQSLDYWNWDADWSNWRINVVNNTISHAGTSQFVTLEAASSIGFKQAQLNAYSSTYDKIGFSNGGGFGGQAMGQGNVDNLALNQMIGQGGLWLGAGDLLHHSGYGTYSGGWDSANGGEFHNTSGYMGFSIQFGGQTCYGWMLLTGTGSGSSLGLTVQEWAWDTEGNAILAGSLTEIPAPGGLAVLALGAAGLRRRRRTD